MRSPFRLASWPLLAAALLLLTGCHAAPPPPNSEPPVLADAHEQAVTEYKRLRSEYNAESQRLRQAWATARANGVPERNWPPFPRLVAIYEEIEELGVQGLPEALAFCILHADEAVIGDMPDIEDRRRAQILRLAEVAPDSQETKQLLRWIGEAYVQVGTDCARRACDLVYAGAKQDESRADARLARVKIDLGLQLRGRDAHTELTPELEHALADIEHEYPDTHGAREAASIRVRLQGLQPGMLAPELEVDDSDGRPMRLAAEHGKVVVLHFWGFW
jgi:hypothetical protein